MARRFASPRKIADVQRVSVSERRLGALHTTPIKVRATPTKPLEAMRRRPTREVVTMSRHGLRPLVSMIGPFRRAREEHGRLRTFMALVAS